MVILIDRYSNDGDVYLCSYDERFIKKYGERYKIDKTKMYDELLEVQLYFNEEYNETVYFDI